MKNMPICGLLMGCIFAFCVPPEVRAQNRAMTADDYYLRRKKDQQQSGGVVGTISGLPLHPVLQGELDNLHGRLQLIENEYVMWNYGFNWSATPAEGGGPKLSLERNMGMRFIRAINGGWLISYSGKLYTVATPPNVTLHNCFMFAILPANGLGTSIIENRLGAPVKVAKQNDGTSVWYYNKEVVYDRTTWFTITSNTNGMNSYGDMFTATTTTAIPQQEEIRYNPYSFAIFFDVHGNVSRVQDLCTKSATWQPKPAGNQSSP
jgi:hypothetical protein